MYALEDTTTLKFGGLCFRMHMFMFVCMCLCLCGMKLCYLVFVYGFENLIKIN